MPTDSFDPTGVFRSCIESGAHALLLDEAALPPHFFDLSSGMAGELLHKLLDKPMPFDLITDIVKFRVMENVEKAAAKRTASQ